MATGFEATDRAVLRISGGDAEKFLQDLVTNDVTRSGLVYAALLSPQGKYLFDFFLLRDGDGWLLDVAQVRASALAQRLSMYKLRADVTIEAVNLRVFQLWGSDLGVVDPRDAALGTRLYAEDAPEMAEGPDWAALRVAHVIPESGTELIPDDSYILECGFERLSGVDFKKGCYVGQEVTARMKHKTELRKGLAQVALEGEVTPGTPIMASEKEAGRLHTVAGDRAIAYVRFDRAKGDLTAGGAKVRLV